MGAPSDSSILIGRRHRTLCDGEMLVLWLTIYRERSIVVV